MLLVCYSYVSVCCSCYSYVLVLLVCYSYVLRMLLVCYSYVTRVTRMYSYVTRMYSYVTRMLLVVLVCRFSHDQWKPLYLMKVRALRSTLSPFSAVVSIL